MLEERECKICGVWFQPKRKNNIYCEECSKRSGAKKKKMKRQIMISISRCGTGISRENTIICHGSKAKMPENHLAILVKKD